MRSLTIQAETWTFPDSRKTLTAQQRRKVLPLLLPDHVGNRERALLLLAGRRADRRALAQALEDVRAADGEASDRIYQVLRLLDPIFQPPLPTSGREKPQALIESFRHHGRRYYLPQPGLSDVVMEEWAVASSLLIALNSDSLSAEQRIALIRQLAAVLCRPLRPWWQRVSIRWDGISRLPWNQQRIPIYQGRFADLPPELLYVVLDYAQRSAIWLSKRYGDLFAGNTTEGDSWGWLGSIIALAGEDATKLNRVGGMKLHDALTYMTRKTQEMKERERLQKIAELKRQSKTRRR